MCIVFSIIEYVYKCLWSFLSSMFVIRSSYVSSLRSHVICIALLYPFVREMSDLLLRTPSHCPFHHHIHYWRDYTSCLIWVDHHLSSHIHCFVVIVIVACDSSHSLHILFFPYSDPSRFRCSLRIIITHVTISSFCSICLLIDIIFTLGILRSMARGVHYTCCISYMRAWVLIIGYLSLVSFHFYHPITLAYVTSRVLRPPWGHGIRCRLRQPLLGQVIEIWLMFRYRHASSSGSRLFDV